MIQIHNLRKTYGHGRHAAEVLHGVSFTLPETGFVCILGASGCGKTSLLNAIGGLDDFQQGTVSTESVTAKGYGSPGFEAERNRNFGYVFQNYYLLQGHSVGYNVYLGLHALDLSHKEKLRRVHQALKAVQMDRFFRRNVADLSGGQQQRVAIARALARRPKVIFADEPTGNLDEANTLKTCALLKKISKNSLVVVVTHEENLAKVFADRIITLDGGNIRSDSQDFARGTLRDSGDPAVYTGELTQSHITETGIELQLLQQEGAAPVKITVVSQQDRIVIQLSDPRQICLNEVPVIEGNRPTLSMETLVDAETPEEELFSAPASEAAKSGQGLGFGHMFREARTLVSGWGAKRVGTVLFLILMTLMTMIMAGDFLQLTTLNPEDFITSDAHILEVELDYGPKAAEGNTHIMRLIGQYMQWLRSSGQDIRMIPHVAATATYTSSAFRQMEEQLIKFTYFSYLPLDLLDESQLIYGRAPENPQEVVVDRWVLEKALKEDGILQNSIPDITFFLGTSISYSKLHYSPVIVGICDTGSPVLYMDQIGLVSLGVGNREAMTVSQLQALRPGKYDDLVIAPGEVVVVLNRAGSNYRNQVGGTFRTTTRTNYTIIGTIEEDIYPAFIASDDAVEDLLWDMTGTRFYLYCEDKEAVKTFLAQNSSPLEQEGVLSKRVYDRYSTTMAAYQQASAVRADARTIVTATVLVLAMVMLYLLCRAQVHSRIGMMAVYRLLGVPNRKLVGIFLMETVLLSAMTTLPAAALCYGGIQLCKLVPEWNVTLHLPLEAAAVIYLAILVYHILVSLLPLGRLLRLPPAKLAAKYDL